MSGLTLADDIVVILTIVTAMVTVPALGPDARRNFLAFLRRHTYRGEFKVTAKTYSEKADLNQAIRNEFGPNYRLADWNEIKKADGGDAQKWVDGIGLKYGYDYFVARERKEFYDGNSENRHYHVTRVDHNPIQGYGVHDSIGNHLVTLGSWHDVQNQAIAIKIPKEAN